MRFHSFPVNLDLNVVIEPQESNVSIAAKDRHQRDMSGPFEPLLKTDIRSRRLSRLGTGAWMTVKVSQKLVTKLLEFDQKVVAYGDTAYTFIDAISHRSATVKLTDRGRVDAVFGKSRFREKPRLN